MNNSMVKKNGGIDAKAVVLFRETFEFIWRFHLNA
jgi:hypothetical protein